MPASSVFALKIRAASVTFNFFSSVSPASVDSMIGELAALLAAATWAVSAMLYRRALPHYGPHQANLYKTTAGALLIWLTLLCWPRAAPSGWRASSLATLSLSGVVGLAIGDTFYFRAMQLLGIQRTVVLFSLSPVFTLALAFAM